MASYTEGRARIQPLEFPPMPAFKLVSDMPAAGDQPAAIDALAEALEAGEQASPCWA